VCPTRVTCYISFMPTIQRWSLATLLLACAPVAFAQEIRQPDLDVTYISRTPRYRRYIVDQLNGVPQQLVPGTENEKRFPVEGELVTYTAHVINKGSDEALALAYEWSMDGVIVQSVRSRESIGPGQEQTFTFQTPWTNTAQQFTFRVDPANLLGESVETNNALTIGSRDLTISYWVERGIYDLFNERTNLAGSRSFEDWIQAHVAKMNERFTQAVYPASPQGILDRVRIDKIVVADDLDSSTSEYALDPDGTLIDGRWPTSDGDPTNARGLGGSWREYVDLFATTIDWGLIHESSHQLGVIDLYRMNIKNNEPGTPNGGVFVKDSTGRVISYERLPFPVFSSGGVMGGGETAPHNNGTYYESHTAGGMNAHAFARRGYFGEYLFDTPSPVRLRVVDAVTEKPIGDARVALFQKDYNTEDIDDAAEMTDTTARNGTITLPNRPVIPIVTATGHTLRENPFGQINPTGQNGTMLARVTKGSQEGLAFFRLHDVNLAYWAGQRKNATVDIRVKLLPMQAPLANQPPTLNAIGNRTVAEGSTLSFTVSASDPAGEPLTYSATLGGGAAFANQRFTWTPDFTQAGFHSFAFTVTDASGQTDSETVLVTVTNTNAPPVARVGVDQVVGPTALVTLDGSLSSDPDRDAITYAWTQTAGPAVTISNPTAAKATFQVPDVSATATLTFSLVVRDATKASTPALSSVQVYPDLPLAGVGQAGGGGRAVTWPQACTGQNRVLIVTTAEWRADANSALPAVSYAGLSLTKLGQSYNTATGALATMWSLAAPPAGMQDVTVTANNANFASFASSCWFGVTPGTFVSAFGTSSTPALIIVGSGNAVIIDAVASAGENPPGAITPSAGQVLLGQFTQNQSRIVHSARIGSTTGKTSTSWTLTGSDLRWAAVGLDLNR
jgi:hypothetical protein